MFTFTPLPHQVQFEGLFGACAKCQTSFQCLDSHRTSSRPGKLIWKPPTAYWSRIKNAYVRGRGFNKRDQHDQSKPCDHHFLHLEKFKITIRTFGGQCCAWLQCCWKVETYTDVYSEIMTWLCGGSSPWKSKHVFRRFTSWINSKPALVPTQN